MRRFRGSSVASAQAAESASRPLVRYVYDRPLPYARHMRIEILGPDGTVVSTSVASYNPGKGWVTEPAAA